MTERARSRIPAAGADAGGKHRDFLNLRRQRCDVRDPGHRQQFAHLLESDLQLAARNHGADALALADQDGSCS